MEFLEDEALARRIAWEMEMEEQKKIEDDEKIARMLQLEEDRTQKHQLSVPENATVLPEVAASMKPNADFSNSNDSLDPIISSKSSACQKRHAFFRIPLSLFISWTFSLYFLQ